MTGVSLRTLGRTLLARQQLLTRTDAPVIDVVSQLVGLQAQVPRDPYLALWSRVAGFTPPDLEALYLDRSVARIVVMRGTIHLLTADDVVRLRNLFQPVLDQEMARHGEHRAALAGLDLAPISAFAETLLTELPGMHPEGLLGIGTVLVDGRLQATWRLARPKGSTATVTIRHRPGLSRRDRAAVLAEAHRALPILTHDAPHAEVVLVAADA